MLGEDRERPSVVREVTETEPVVGDERLQGRREIIEEGSWGSRGGVLSFLDLLDQSGAAFAPERTAAIRAALSVKYDR